MCTLINNAKERKALPSQEEVEGFELSEEDYIGLFRYMVQNKELPELEMYHVDTWQDEDFLPTKKYF